MENISVSDLFYFDTAPAPRIRSMEKRIRILIQPTIEKIQTFFLRIIQKMIVKLFYEPIIF